jgi:hypothetical protein
MVCTGLDTVLRCLLYRDEVPWSEWILFSHQLGPLARVSLAFFFVAVPVGAAIWHYYGLCWVRHHPPVLIVSWWGPLQWVNPLQPSVRSAGQSFFSLLLCCCSSRGCNMGLVVCAGLDTVLRCLLYRDEVPSSEWILFNHQLGPLARVSLAFFFAVVPVVVAI